MKKSSRSFILYFFILSSSYSYGDFNRALNNYKNNNFPEANKEFKLLAALGHKQSQMNVAAMFVRGEGVEKDLTEGYAWFALSATDGDLSRTQMKEKIFNRLDESQKKIALQKADQLINTYGDTQLALDLYPSYSDEKSKYKYPELVDSFRLPPKGFKMFNYVEIEYDVDKNGVVKNYSVPILDGDMTAQEIIYSFEKYKSKAAKFEGKSIAHFQTRTCAERLDLSATKRQDAPPLPDLDNADEIYGWVKALYDVPRKPEIENKIKKLRLLAAQMGNSEAQRNLASLLIFGSGVRREPQKALKWMTTEMSLNDPVSMYWIGSILLEGELIDQDKLKAIEFLQRSANLQNPKAIMKLAWILATDKDPKIQNPKKSLALVNAVYENYLDKTTGYETLAAAFAANGMFEQAISAQLQAVTFAKGTIGRLDAANLHLTRYQQQQAWSE